MTKKQKTWTIIMIVVGAAAVLGSFGNLKEYWFSLIIGLGMVAGGILILTSAKRKAKKEVERNQAEQEQRRAEHEARIAEEQARLADQDARKREIVFTATYTERFQDRIAKQYKKELNDAEYLPYYDIKPYLSYDGVSTRYNILVDDDKIGEVPASNFREFDDVINLRPRNIDCVYILSQTESGTKYDVEVHYTYWKTK